MCKFSSKAVPRVLRRCTFLYPCVYETTLPMLLYAVHTHTHTHVLPALDGPPDQTAVSYSQGCRGNVAMEKILGNFHVPKDLWRSNAALRLLPRSPTRTRD